MVAREVARHRRGGTTVPRQLRDDGEVLRGRGPRGSEGGGGEDGGGERVRRESHRSSDREWWCGRREDTTPSAGARARGGCAGCAWPRTWLRPPRAVPAAQPPEEDRDHHQGRDLDGRAPTPQQEFHRVPPSRYRAGPPSTMRR